MPTTPVLWHFPVSHFNEKVRWALDFKRIPHVRQARFLDYLPRALWATGHSTLPILPRSARAGVAKVRAALDRIAAELAPSGYLVADRFSVADPTAAALFSPLVIPKEFPYPIPIPLPRWLADFHDSLSSHPAFEWAGADRARGRCGGRHSARW